VVDWLTIRNDYINGGGSYRKLAEKYGVNKDTIAKRAKSEGWKEQRDIQTDRTQTETIQKTTEKIADALSEEAATKARIRAKLFQLAEDWVCKREEIGEDTNDYRRIVQCCMDMGVFDDNANKPGASREADPLSKALQELAEVLNYADQ
jgi:lysophospholipase L1-like esterase